MIAMSQFQFGVLEKLLENHSNGLKSIDKLAIVKFDKCDGTESCLHCVKLNLLKSVEEMQNEVSKFARNTVWIKSYVSLTAFLQACEKLDVQFNIDDVMNLAKGVIKRKIVRITLNHYAMEPNGMAKGYESVTFKATAYKRSNIGLTQGIPYLLDNWVLNMDSFKIDSTDLFESEEPTAENHREDCEFKGSEFFEHCDCLDYAELYCSTEENDYDFWWNELDYILESIFEKLPVAEFTTDNDKRIWSIGDESIYNMDKITEDPDYLNELQYNNGLNDSIAPEKL